MGKSLGGIKSRLDYFLISKNLVNNCDMTFKTKIIISNKVGRRLTDHKLIEISLKIYNQKKGPGYWKLNNTLLSEEEYLEKIKNAIRDIKKHSTEKEDKKRVWEEIKSSIRKISIDYSRNRAKRLRLEEKKLSKEVERLQNKGDLNEDEKELLDSLEIKLLRHYFDKAKGAQIRARVQWIEEGERNTAYFYGVEKSRQRSNTISHLEVGGKTERDQSVLLQEIWQFYKDLYTSTEPKQEKIDKYLKDLKTIKKLSSRSKSALDQEITEAELKETIKGLKPNKSPGKDGLTGEFYKIFWDELKDIYLDMVRQSLGEGQLPLTTRTAVISLIYKKGEKNLLSNYRPISLTNLDFRILTQTFARRLQKILGEIISKEQTAYLKGRDIADNIRIMGDICDYCDFEKIDGALVGLDFQKAFDNLEWDFMFSALQKQNFGPNFCNFMRTLYNKPIFSVKNNQWLTKPIEMGRGVRQGCSVSALVFILMVEIMGTAIRENDQIEGIKVDGRVYKTSQFADDTTLIMKNVRDICETLKEIEKFSEVSGLKLNINKCEGVWLGPNRNWQVKMVKGIKFNNKFICCLGQLIGNDTEEGQDAWWTNKIRKVEKKIQNWKKRNMSISGKIEIINMTLLPLFYNRLTYTVLPEEKILKIEKIIKDFIGMKSFNIPYSVLINSKVNGGIGLTDLRTKNIALLAKWIPKLLGKDHVDQPFLKFWLKKMVCPLVIYLK